MKKRNEIRRLTPDRRNFKYAMYMPDRRNGYERRNGERRN